MIVRLIDVDSKMPNLALMKIYTYHKNRGDDVDWYNPLVDYGVCELCYASKIFTFTLDYAYYPDCEVLKGGTGFDLTTNLPLEIEACDPDYTIYPDCDYSIQFLSRGCIRKCAFCVVPIKEGLIRKVPAIQLNPRGKYIKLLDNNFFACPGWKENISILRDFNQPVEFNSGIDLRILTEEQCEALATLKIKDIKCAFDSWDDRDTVIPKLKLLIQYIKPYKITCYVLVGFKTRDIIDSDLERVMILRSLGVNPFAMGYIDFNDPNWQKSESVKAFCRWVNRKAIFKSCTWAEYWGGKK